jgi:hypothetical protein
VRHVAEIDPPSAERQWLVDDLWLEAGVGILGGAPKVCKTYLAVEISVAVACGRTVLGHAARRPGPVLFYGAEDSVAALRERFGGMATVHNLSLEHVPIYLVDVPVLRLDRERDLVRLRGAVEKYRPRLLVLDPFVRLARVDENSAADVSGVLASLRAIQRDYNVAVLLVHHARKSPASHPHQALRGSSDFAAWSDSNLYLTRQQRYLTLFVEHRSAPSPDPLYLCLHVEPAPHLVLTGDVLPLPSPDATLNRAVLECLRRSNRPLSTSELRELLRRRKADVVQALRELQADGSIDRDLYGWRISTTD